MIINPNSISIGDLVNAEVQVQGAGIDLTAGAIYKFTSGGALDFSNAKRRLPETAEIEWLVPGGGYEIQEDAVAEHLIQQHFIDLAPGGYLVRYNEIVEVPADAVGIILPRSSLMRSGATLYSAVWDPGYKGRGQGLLNILNPIRLFKNARIGQIFFIRLEESASRLYQGKYQNESI